MKDRNQRNGQNPRRNQNHSASPEVVYTQPEPLNRKIVILQLATVCAVVLALFIGFSIFFRVDTILVSGENKYTEYTVLMASEIEKGDSLLTFGKAQACSNIIAKLPYVENVRVRIKLPGTVIIDIEEVDVVYSVQDESDGWWFMTAGGRLVEPTNRSEALKHTIIEGIKLVAPVTGEQAAAAEPEPDETYVVGDEEHTVVTVTNGERLQTVKEILGELEKNEILGEATKLDVTDMGEIYLWFGDNSPVRLGDPGKLEEKIKTLKGILNTKKIAGYTLDLTNDTKVTLTPLD